MVARAGGSDVTSLRDVTSRELFKIQNAEGLIQPAAVTPSLRVKHPGMVYIKINIKNLSI